MPRDGLFGAAAMVAVSLPHNNDERTTDRAERRAERSSEEAKKRKEENTSISSLRRRLLSFLFSLASLLMSIEHQKMHQNQSME